MTSIQPIWRRLAGADALPRAEERKNAEHGARKIGAVAEQFAAKAYWSEELWNRAALVAHLASVHSPQTPTRVGK